MAKFSLRAKRGAALGLLVAVLLAGAGIGYGLHAQAATSTAKVFSYKDANDVTTNSPLVMKMEDKLGNHTITATHVDAGGAIQYGGAVGPTTPAQSTQTCYVVRDLSTSATATLQIVGPSHTQVPYVARTVTIKPVPDPANPQYYWQSVCVDDANGTPIGSFPGYWLKAVRGGSVHVYQQQIIDQQQY